MPPYASILPQLGQQRKIHLVCGACAQLASTCRRFGTCGRFLWLAALAGLVLYLAITLHLCALALAYPYQLDYGEGLVLYQARLLAQGHSIYKGVAGYPYVFSNYAPLLQAVTSPLVAVLGPSFLPGRLLALAATLALGALLFYLVRSAGGGRLSALVASLLFLGSPYIYHWAPLFRIDLPALFLSVLGLAVIARGAGMVPSAEASTLSASNARTNAAPNPTASLSGLVILSQRSVREKNLHFGVVTRCSARFFVAPLLRMTKRSSSIGSGIDSRACDSRDVDRSHAPEKRGAGHDRPTALPTTKDGMYLAGLLFALGFYTKQSYAAAPAAALAYLAIHDRPAARRLVCALLLFGLLPFLGLELLTRGAFSFGLFTANVNPFSLSLLASQVRDFVATFAVIILLAVVGAASKQQRVASSEQAASSKQQADGRREHASHITHQTPLFAPYNRRLTRAPYPSSGIRHLASRILHLVSRFSLLDLYLLVSLATILLAGKVGAWENYFFEALFMLSLYAGLGVDRMVGRVSIPDATPPAAAIEGRLAHRTGGRVSIADTVLPLLLLGQLALMWHDPSIGIRMIAEDGAANRTLAPLIARQTGMILSEDVGLLVLNGQDVPYFSFQYTQLARVGRWDQTWETESLRAALFALVVLEKGTREDPDHYQRFSRRVLSEVDRSYGLLAEVGKYRVYVPAPMQRSLDVEFGGEIALVGVRIEPERESLDSLDVPPPNAKPVSFNPYPAGLRLSLLWQARQKITRDYKVFVHLEDAAGVRHAQRDAMPMDDLYPTSHWERDELVRDAFELALPPGLPPGRYTLRVGLYEPASGQRLARGDGSTSFVLASLPLSMPEAGMPQHPQAVHFENGITLLGYDLDGARPGTPPAITPGAPLTVTLHWQTDRYLDLDYTVFLHLASGDDPVAQADSQPQGGTYPTSAWNPREHVTDSRVLTIPKDLAPGSFSLLTGLYYLPTGRRVLVTPDEGCPTCARPRIDNVLLTEVRLERP